MMPTRCNQLIIFKVNSELLDSFYKPHNELRKYFVLAFPTQSESEKIPNRNQEKTRRQRMNETVGRLSVPATGNH